MGRKNALGNSEHSKVFKESDMALVASIHVDLGWELPDMKLTSPAGESVALREQMGEKGLLVAFTCNHCPYAIAV